jgi:hypothetical protein
MGHEEEWQSPEYGTREVERIVWPHARRLEVRPSMVFLTAVVLWTTAPLALSCATQETGTLKITVTNAQGDAIPHAKFA